MLEANDVQALVHAPIRDGDLVCLAPQMHELFTVILVRDDRCWLRDLQSGLDTIASRADSTNGGLFDFDRSKLASELDDARARERQLEEAGAEASRALGEAIEGIKRALERVEDA